MIQMTVFLPNFDQCEAFKLKTKRRFEYIELQNQLSKKAKTLSDFTAENIDEDQSNMSGSTLPMSCEVEETSTITNFDNYDYDTSSKMSYQSSIQDDLSKKKTDSRKLDQTNYDEFDANMASKVNLFVDIENNYNEENEDENDNETHLGDVVERSEADLAELDAEWIDNDNNVDINIDEDEVSNLLIDEYDTNGESTSLNTINPTSLFNFTFPKNEISTQYTNKPTNNKQRVKFAESFEPSAKNSDYDKVPESLNIFSSDSKKCYEPDTNDTNKSNTSVSESRFINSKLDVNEDLGTRSKTFKL